MMRFSSTVRVCATYQTHVMTFYEAIAVVNMTDEVWGESAINVSATIRGFRLISLHGDLRMSETRRKASRRFDSQERSSAVTIE